MINPNINGISIYHAEAKLVRSKRIDTKWPLSNEEFKDTEQDSNKEPKTT